MKIYSVTDIHESYKELEIFYDFARKNKADMIFVLGDLVDRVFNNHKQEQEYLDLHNLMKRITFSELEKRKVHKDIKLNPFDYVKAQPIIAEEILAYGNYPKEWQNIANNYLHLLDDVASKNMDRKYRIIKGIIGDNKDVFVLPGNYDKSLEETVLAAENIHLKSKKINGFNVAGYGSGGIFSLQGNVNLLKLGKKGIFMPLLNYKAPIELAVEYNDFVEKNNFYSEGTEYFKKINPDIVLLHIPPFGCCDEISLKEDQNDSFDSEMENIDYEHSGSLSTYSYLSDSSVKLVLSGHIHGAKGIKLLKNKKNLTVVINSGTLKDEGKKDNRSFLEIELDDNTKSFKKCTFYKIQNNGSVIDTKSYVYDKDLFELREINSLPDLIVVPAHYANLFKMSEENMDKVRKK